MRLAATRFSTIDAVQAERHVATRPRRHAVARGANGLPRTYRLVRSSAQNTAYCRLALAILGLHIATLAHELRSARAAVPALITSTSTFAAAS